MTTPNTLTLAATQLASTQIVAENQITKIIQNFGGNFRDWVAAGMILLGIFAIGYGFFRLVQWLKQDQGERQQKKYSLPMVIVLLLVGILLVGGGAWVTLNGEADTFGVTTDDFIGNPDNGQVQFKK